MVDKNESVSADVEMDVPDYAIERLARCLLPMIREYYESEEGRQELAEWRHRQEHSQENI